ncbi:MAG: hypoxanthine phosphoribosyltransferase [Bacilli bacterium]|jgi:hypoxanthine phosphoribosyltransferase|nr:hypoxanthine phosphoribosyltransferase [Bacilli bacterium]
MMEDIKEILVDNKKIEARCEELGKEISKDYQGRLPILVGLLKGSVPFMAELIKHINIQVETEYMVVSSYGGGITSSGEIQIINDLTISPQGRDIIIVEDIVDSGLTLDTIIKLLKYRGASSVEVACLLSKPDARKVKVDVKYLGFNIKNEFVVGFGLDYDQLYRNLPFVGILKEEIYKK